MWALTFSADGRRLFAGGGWRGESGIAQLWDLETHKPIGAALPVDSQVFAVAMSPDGRTLLTGNYNHRAQLWEADTGRPSGQPLDHTEAVLLSAFSPDGTTMMTATYGDGTPLFWDVATRQRLDRRLDHGADVRSAVWSRDGRLILTGGSDGAAKLWHAGTGRHVVPPMQHQGHVGTVALSDDNRYVL
ncbi:MAG: serine/threonine protein kinase, partial [Actinomycetota bacterium]